MTESKRLSMRERLNLPDNIKAIKYLIETEASVNVNSLALALCEQYHFIAANGEPQVSGCKVVLNDMHESEIIKLPKIERAFKPTFTSMVIQDEPIDLPPNMPSCIDDINIASDLVIVLLGGKGIDLDLKVIWNTLIAKEHPQGDSRLAGYMVKYLIKYKGYYIGAASFSSGSLALEARDKWIGWTTDQHNESRSKVMNMSRFLIRNDIHCKNLSSYLLSKLIKRISNDFEDRYKIKLWLLETFVDSDKYLGTSYKATNWILVGKTKCRGRNDTLNQKNKSAKDIYIYVLNKSFRKEGELPPPPVKYPKMAIETCLDSDQWVGHEFGHVNLGDKRLNARLATIVKHKCEAPSASYTAACSGSSTDIQRYSQFLANKREQANDVSILGPHRHNTICRMASFDRVLSIHDTSSLNYSTLHGTEGLGFIGKNNTEANGTLGLDLHCTLSTTIDGAPIGVTKAPCSAPKYYSKAENKKRKHLPIEEKASNRWLVGYRDDVEIAKDIRGTQVVSVMDREGDIYALYDIADKNRALSPIVIRARHNRNIKLTGDEDQGKLFDLMDASESTFESQVDIPPQREIIKKSTAHDTRPYMRARKATLTIAYGEVTIMPSSDAPADSQPITLNYVYATEKGAPLDSEKICWRLLTTLKIQDNAQALECLSIYKSRWRVEEFFRILKSGCKVEDHRQNHADKLKKAIAIDVVIAWRLMLLSFLGRTHPDIPAEAFFSPDEITVIGEIVKKKVLI